MAAVTTTVLRKLFIETGLLQLFYDNCLTATIVWQLLQQLFYGNCFTETVNGNCFTATVLRHHFYGNCFTATLQGNYFTETVYGNWFMATGLRQLIDDPLNERCRFSEWRY
jgi:hypothetical protein